MRFGNNLIVIKVTLLLSLLLITNVNAQIGDLYKLNDDLVVGGDVKRYQISPDGKYVVYLADQDFDEVFDLYSVPITGGQPIRLRQVFLFGGRLQDFQISPDSSRVVYRERVNTDAFGGFTIDLFSVPIEGGFATDISVAGPQRGVVQYEISADSSRVVFTANRDNETAVELYSVPLVGGEVVKLNPAFTGGKQIAFFDINSESERVVYLSNQDADDAFEAYSVSIDEANSVKMNDNLTLGGNVVTFGLSKDSETVIYLADQENDEVFELYSVPLPRNGAVPIKLNDSLVAGGDVASLNFFASGPQIQITNDSQNVVYSADQETDGTNDLYVVPIRGGMSEKLSINVGNPVGVEEFKLSKDSQRVVYSESSNLYSVPIIGGTPVKLNSDLVFGGFVSSFSISPDSHQVVFVAAQDSLTTEIFSTPITGAGDSPVRLNSLLRPGESVDAGDPIIIGEGDHTRVLYSTSTGDFNGFDPDLTEGFVAPTTGSSNAIKINSGLQNGANGVRALLTSPDNERVIYLADQNTTGQFELFVRELFDALNEEFCVPIKAKNGKLSVICL